MLYGFLYTNNHHGYILPIVGNVLMLVVEGKVVVSSFPCSCARRKASSCYISLQEAKVRTYYFDVLFYNELVILGARKLLVVGFPSSCGGRKTSSC